MNNSESIEGSVESIIYANPENGYSVFAIDMNDDQIICTGSVPYLNEGEVVSLKGHYIVHPVYGRQFNVAEYTKNIPTTVSGMEKYLGSGVIKGLGVKMAAKIVAEFGDETFEVMENHPEKLSQIKGITLQKAMDISAVFHEQAGQRVAMIFLQNYGISANVATKIYKYYKEKTIDVVKSNPYALADAIAGVGFKTADSIAYRLGILPESIDRLKAGVRYTLSNALSNGHVYLPKDELMADSARLLEVSPQLVDIAIAELHIDKSIVIENLGEQRVVYLNAYYYAESYVARKLLELDENKEEELKDSSKIINFTCKQLNIELAKNQKLAVAQSLKGGVLVITGGPGTGKTTTINTIITILNNQELDIELAAPTGRAAKRMSEATGMEAKTIHRLLEVKYVAEANHRQTFEKNELEPIQADVIIIDEISMVDIMLMYNLLKAIEPGTRLILVGDADQLPSVGAGNVLKDIIASACLNVVYLDEIFRQAQLSDIVVNAHSINKGMYPVLNGEAGDFFMVKRGNVDHVLSAILELADERLPNFRNYDRKRDIQVLTPMRKTKLGVVSLNQELQQRLNPSQFSKKEYEYRDFVFREGDKVMQMKNNYNIQWEIQGQKGFMGEEGQGIFNGDEGIIKSINHVSEKITVLFDDGKKVDYDFTQLDELELAYAITIHKSQGSEYKAVIIPVHSGPPMLLSRNLLYTGVTRAKEMVVLVGTEDCLKRMVDNNREISRYSALNQKLIKFAKFIGTD